MNEMQKSLRPWVNFAGSVLVVAVLYWAQVVLIPVAFALLLSFVLLPLVVRLQRWFGRVAAVLLAVALVFLALGLAGWGLSNQLTSLIADLPGYRANIREKIADVRQAGKGTSVETVQETLEEIKTQLEDPDGSRGKGRPVEPLIVRSERVASLWGFPAWLGPVVGPLTTAGLVIVMVIFMLLEREALRARILGLVGHGHLAATTKAIDEAGRRVSRQLLVQTLVNLIYGLGVGVGLYFIGVPYAFLWASLASVLRFIPYIGPVSAAAAPIVVALAALPGWSRPFMVMALFAVLELFTNLVLETLLFAGAAGVSAVALLISLAFWTWLWGPMGLLMSTPLTICLVVLGKHVQGMRSLSILMSDDPQQAAGDKAYYQRLLAHDPSEASDLIERHIKAHSAETVYDALLLPALSYAEHDRLENRLSDAETHAIVEATRELMGDASSGRRTARTVAAGEPPPALFDQDAPPMERVTVLAWPANAKSELALRMLGELLEGTSVALDIMTEHKLSAEIVPEVQQRGCRIVCIADLPPSSPSRTRYLIKKLRAALPELTIVVGRWAPPALADDRPELLLEAGANHVGTTLLETRDQLCQLPRLTVP
jgi:predicted PurR-regulated permease PerM